MLLQSTVDIIRSALRADPHACPADRARLLAVVRTGGGPQPKTAPPETGPRILARAEVARRLAKTTRFVDRLAQQGVLKKVRLPGRVRAAGFLESDVNALLAGKD